MITEFKVVGPFAKLNTPLLKSIGEKTISASCCYFVWVTNMSLFTFIVKNAHRYPTPEISSTGEDHTEKGSIGCTKLPLFWAGISLRGQDYIRVDYLKTRLYAIFRWLNPLDRFSISLFQDR